MLYSPRNLQKFSSPSVCFGVILPVSIATGPVSLLQAAKNTTVEIIQSVRFVEGNDIFIMRSLYCWILIEQT